MGHFEWDEGNELKPVSHGLTPMQVESTFQDRWAIRRTSMGRGEARWEMIAVDDEGTILFVVYTHRGRRIRVVTARRASQRESAIYRRRRR